LHQKSKLDFVLIARRANSCVFATPTPTTGQRGLSPLITTRTGNRLGKQPPLTTSATRWDSSDPSLPHLPVKYICSTPAIGSWSTYTMILINYSQVIS
ncbi:MAG: hypothetical protein Q9214_005948, partial [Letrouitia sp. 1 TL-2023]